MKRILIFGHKGEVGSVVYAGVTELENVEVETFDLPEQSMANFTEVKNFVDRSDIVIYAADAKRDGINENWRSDHLYAENYAYEMNLLTALIETKVPKLIFCSSVHADNFLDYEGEGMLSTPGSHRPKSVYGAHKIIFEEYVRFHASYYGFQAVGIRLGGVTADNSVRTKGKEPLVWLSHKDLKNLIAKIVQTVSWEHQHELIYAVSNNTGRIHDTSNSFGWEPTENSQDFINK